MKHLRLYEDGELLKDLQNLDLSEKLLGWWVTTLVGGHLNHYVIYDTSKEDALYRFTLYLLSYDIEDGFDRNEIKDAKDFNDLEHELYDYFVDNNMENGIKIIAWEMTPTTRDVREKMCKNVNQQYNISHVYKTGKKYFRDFDQVMNKNIEGTE